MARAPHDQLAVPERAAPSPQDTGLPAEDRIVLRGHPAPSATREPAVGIPRADGLVRRRLFAGLDRIGQVRICAVVAPAGSGKTTALAQWARRSALDVAWWRADPTPDGAADELVRGIAAAVRRAGARVPARPDPVLLADALAQRASDLVLVIDDLHHVDGPETGQLLEQLLLASDERLHLIVCSHSHPQLNLARTELGSTVVGPGELRFRTCETADLFRTVYDAPLGADDARHLTRHTDGWAAGLHLFHQATAGRAPDAVHRAVRAVHEQTGFVEDYLSRAVLADLSADEVDFLRSTAPLETLTGARCDRLTGRVDSLDLLTELHGRGILVAAEDGGGLTVPRTLRAHLVAELREQLGPESTDSRFAEAAHVLADSTDPVTLARTLAAGRHWAAAVAVLEDHWEVVVDHRDLDWLAAAPAAVAAESAVRVALAERARRDGDLRRAADLLGSGPPVPSGTPQAATADAVARFARMWTVGDLQPGRSWVEYLRAAVRRPDPRRRTALESPYGELLRSVELALSGDLRAARRTIAACPGRLYADTWAWCAAELLLAALSPEPTERAGSVAARADDLGLPWLARIAHALGAPSRPADAIAAEVGEADDRGDAWGALLLIAIDAIARLRERRRADGVFEELVARCRRIEAPAFEAWARSGLALCAATTRLPDAARDAESAVAFAHSAQVPGALVFARAALAVARSDADLRRLAAEEARQVGLGRRWAAWIDARPDARTSVAATVRTPPVAVRCFGGFDIRVEDAAPSLSGVRPRARALLRLLSLYAGQPVHREVLVDAMWPQLDIDAGTHNLHVCISGLRTTLEPGVARGASRLIVRDGDRYLLALPPGSTSDLRSFDERLATADRSRASGEADEAIADLEEALRLYVGEVLPEDGPTDWVVPHRDHYQVRAAEGAALLGRLHLDKGRPETAAQALRRSIDIDPCRDASWRLLVAAHEAAGDLAAAEEARRSYADVLTTLGLVATTANTMRTP